MGKRIPKVVVTPPAFCQSKLLCTELLRLFPDTRFNLDSSYLEGERLIAFLKDADAAIIGRDLISKDVIAALPKLKILAKYGVGLDNIDQKALGRHGVALCWTPGVNSRSVAEMTLCFMVGLCRNIFLTGYQLKAGSWDKKGGNQVTGKTVGIIGYGNVGREVLRLLEPFNCQILIRDILDVAEFCRSTNAEICGFDKLIRESDIVTLHVPLTDQTRSFINWDVLKRMRPSAYLINTSRGEVVDQQALKLALRLREISGAALDVFDNEPPEDLGLLSLPNLMVTPHIGGNSAEAIEAMGRAAIEHLFEYFRK